jgi:hypothetical protein
LGAFFCALDIKNKPVLISGFPYGKMSTNTEILKMDVTRFFIYTYVDDPSGEEYALEVCSNDYNIYEARTDYPSRNFIRVEGPDLERLDRIADERMRREMEYGETY